MKGDAFSLDDWDGLNGWDFFGFISSNGWKLQLGQQVEELKDELVWQIGFCFCF